MNTEINIEQIATAKLKPAPYNPRRIKPEVLEMLKRSMTEYGINPPLIVNRKNMRVVGGNQRLRAAKELGLETVPVAFVNLGTPEEKALNLALNKITADWDFDKLRGVLGAITDLEHTVTGYDPEELVLLLRANEETEAGTREEETGKGDTFGEGSDAAIREAADAAAGRSLSYVVCLQFKSAMDSDTWLASRGITHEFKPGERTFVVRK